MQKNLEPTKQFINNLDLQQSNGKRNYASCGGLVADIAELTGKSQRTISQELQEYQDSGLLRREGVKERAMGDG